MPKYKPSILISDCWGSVGDLTFYHVDGKCFYKSKPRCSFPATAGQLENQELHRRALAAWRTLEPAMQALWHLYAKEAVSHRPPFDGKAHISGHNLFVSAYHNFAIMGQEHLPEPRPFAGFPVYAMTFQEAERDGETGLVLRFRVRLMEEAFPSPGRWQLLLKLQLTWPAGGKKPGLMRNVLAEGLCEAGDSVVSFRVADYRRVWDLDLHSYHAHAQSVLLDRETGYRDIHHDLSFDFSLM